MGAATSKSSTETYSYSDIAAAALYTVSSSCKASASSSQELNLTGSTITGSTITLTAQQRVQCLSTISADSTFDTNFSNALDNLINTYTSGAIGYSTSANDVKNSIVSQVKQSVNSNTAAELFGATAQTQLVNVINTTVTNSTVDIQADSFIKVVSDILSKNGVTGEVTVDYKTDTSAKTSDVVSNVSGDAAGVLNNAVSAVGTTASGIVDVAKTGVSGIVNILGSPIFLIIIAVIIIGIIYFVMKNPSSAAMLAAYTNDDDPAIMSKVEKW